MKKYLIVLAAVVLGLASCNNQEGGEYTRVGIKQAEIAIAVGESAKLNLVWEPTTLNAPVCVWESSDSSIVTVDENGNIKGIALGKANVSASLGNHKGVCEVSVKDPYELIEWAGATWWNVDKTPLSNDTIVIESQKTPGVFFHCLPILATFRIWDSDISFDDEEGVLTGTGLSMAGTGCALLITDSLDKYGPNYYYLGRDTIRFVDPEKWDPTKAEYAYTAPAGKIVGTAEDHYAWYTDKTNTVEPAWIGTEIFMLNWDSLTYEEGGVLDGFMDEGYFVGDEQVCYSYDVNANFFDFLFLTDKPSYDGFALTWVEGATEEETGWGFVNPLEWAPLSKKHFKLEGNAAAPREEVRKFAKPIQMPARKIKNTNVLIKK